jgi:hypothetical protein
VRELAHEARRVRVHRRPLHVLPNLEAGRHDAAAVTVAGRRFRVARRGHHAGARLGLVGPGAAVPDGMGGRCIA